MKCNHPPIDLYSWVVKDDLVGDTLVICCKKCKQVLRGSAETMYDKYEAKLKESGNTIPPPNMSLGF